MARESVQGRRPELSGATTRVLQVIPTLERGGAERLVVNLVIHHGLEDVLMGVVSLYGPLHGPLEEQIGNAEVPHWFLGKRPGFDPRVLIRLRGVLRRFRPDVVHTHLYALRYVLPLMPRSASRIVHTAHTIADREEQDLGLRLHRLAFRRGAQPVAVGEAVAESLQHVYGVTAPPVIHNGVPLDAFFGSSVTERARWRRTFELRPGTVTVGCVANFSEPKNHALLVRSFSRVVAGGTDAVLFLVGTGPLEPKLRALVGQLDLTARVRFLGARDDVPQILAGLDIFTLASLWEGAPFAVVEAMAAGLPIVATRVGAIPELLTHEVSGLLIESEDEAGLADAMSRLARDESLRARLGQSAATTARDRFDIRTIARAYASVYQSVLGERPG